MCAALLHVLSDLLRSTTTLVEAIVIITVSDQGGNICSTQADGIATLAVCSIIVIGATGALLTWMREVYIYITLPGKLHCTCYSINHQVNIFLFSSVD